MESQSKAPVALPAAAAPPYAIGLADSSHAWYAKHAVRARRAYKAAETALVVIGAAIPTSAVLVPNTNVIPAVLGAVVVTISGLRAVFHWQENYLRFSQAREAIEAERRMYHTSAKPYDDPATKEQLLAAAVTRIESEELHAWIQIAARRPKA
jgi:hypothetical protein